MIDKINRCHPAVVLVIVCLCPFMGCWQKDPTAGWKPGQPLPGNVETLEAIASQGHVKAQFELGRRFDEGDGTHEDVRRAVSWFRKAAEQGHAEAEYRLGLALSKGRGVKKDVQESSKWLRRAAEQDVVEAMYLWGKALASGEGVLENDREANEWFAKAAHGDHPAAQLQMGINCLYGEGVTADPIEAYAWFNIASARGDLQARKQKELLAGRLSRLDIEQAQARSQELQDELKNKGAGSP